MSIRIAFSVVRIAETQRQRRSLKPDLPIEHLQSQASLRLDGFCHPPRHAQIAIARHLSRPNSPRVLPWGLSDDGPSASPIVATGRRPKPFTTSTLAPRFRGV